MWLNTHVHRHWYCRGVADEKKEKKRQREINKAISTLWLSSYSLRCFFFLAAQSVISNFRQWSTQRTTLRYHNKGLSLMRITQCLLAAIIFICKSAHTHTHKHTGIGWIGDGNNPLSFKLHLHTTKFQLCLHWMLLWLCFFLTTTGN